MRKILQNIILLFTAILCLSALGWWLTENPVKNLSVSEPGLDKTDEILNKVTENIEIGAFFENYSHKESSLLEKWPCFRGSLHDNISSSGIPLTDHFGGKADIRWSVELGEGHAGAAIYDGMVYVLDYDEEQKADMLRCFSLSDGKEIWRRWYQVHIKRNHGMSRTIPAVTDKYVLTIGPRCHVMCVERLTGKYLWGIDIEKEYESEVPLWYTGQCPLIDGETAVIATGGKALMIGVDCSSGRKLWETPNNNNWKMSHSSVMQYTYSGHKMYVYAAIGGVCGVEAEGENTGVLLWENSGWAPQVVAPSPVCMPDGKIFLTAGYGAGSMVLQLSRENNRFTSRILQDYKPVEGLACEQQTPIYADGHLFAVMPKDGGILRNQFVCVDPRDCKKIVWSSGKTNRFGLGPYMLADNKFFLLNDDGTLTIIKKSSKEYIQLDSLRIFEGQDAWAPMAIADGYLILRDSKTMYCINIKAVV